MTDLRSPFIPTREAALERLGDFVEAAGERYARNRNHDHGPGDRSNVSLLSPWLRHRLLLEEEVLAAVLERHGAAADKFVQEVFWRTYFKGWLERHPDTWRRYCAERDRALRQVEQHPDLAARVEAARTGETGIDCFDAWAQELRETGYLHNHARMWFASIWVFTLELPWTLGADFFLRHLMDGDPAANTLGWRWVSGLHTRGKIYLARAGNIAKYTGDRFAIPSGLAERAAPLEEAKPPTTEALAAAPERVAPAGAWGLLVTEDDCHPESLGLSRTRAGSPQAVLGLLATEDRSPGSVSAAVLAFARGAVADAISRSRQSAGLHANGATVAESSTDWGEALTAWARHHGLSTIVTAHTPVGPSADRLARARAALHTEGIQLLSLRRGWDTRAWAFADRGYFKLRKRIPRLLAEAGLPVP